METPLKRHLRIAVAVMAGSALVLWLGLALTAETKTDFPEFSLPLENTEVRMVKDLLSEELPGDLPYPYDSFVDFVQIGDVIVFRAWDGVHGWELWRTDGTAQGS